MSYLNCSKAEKENERKEEREENSKSQIQSIKVVNIYTPA